MSDTYVTLGSILQKRGLMNPAEILSALAGWMDADAIPAMCTRDCTVKSVEHVCQHGNPSIVNFINRQTVKDAALIVNLRRLGITGDLQYIREKYKAESA